jgi:acyl carrier protein
MTPESIALEVRHFIIENFLFGETADPLRDDDSFLDNGILDSTGVLQLVAFLEERFQIKVEDEELLPENLDSLENVVRYLGEKLGWNA